MSFSKVFDFDRIKSRKLTRREKEFLKLLQTPEERLPAMLNKSKRLTNMHFGRNIYLYNPLYISDVCQNSCSYCLFSHNQQKTNILSEAQMRQEMKALRGKGYRSILIVAGQMDEKRQLDICLKATKIASTIFDSISLEIGSLSKRSLQTLVNAGADSYVLYQETYDPIRYQRFHTGGIKKDYSYRLDSHDIAAMAGFQRSGLGCLLGLSDPFDDLLSLFDHVKYLFDNHRGINVSVSLPRLCLDGIEDKGEFYNVSDVLFVKAIAAFRIMFPAMAIYISTRERPGFRELLIGSGITHISINASTSVGGYIERSKKGQFETKDKRELDELKKIANEKGYRLVAKDWDSAYNHRIL